MSASEPWHPANVHFGERFVVYSVQNHLLDLLLDSQRASVAHLNRNLPVQLLLYNLKRVLNLYL